MTSIFTSDFENFSKKEGKFKSSIINPTTHHNESGSKKKHALAFPLNNEPTLCYIFSTEHKKDSFFLGGFMQSIPSSSHSYGGCVCTPSVASSPLTLPPHPRILFCAHYKKQQKKEMQQQHCESANEVKKRFFIENKQKKTIKVGTEGEKTKQLCNPPHCFFPLSQTRKLAKKIKTNNNKML